MQGLTTNAEVYCVKFVGCVACVCILLNIFCTHIFLIAQLCFVVSLVNYLIYKDICPDLSHPRMCFTILGHRARNNTSEKTMATLYTPSLSTQELLGNVTEELRVTEPQWLDIREQVDSVMNMIQLTQGIPRSFVCGVTSHGREVLVATRIDSAR